MPMPPSRSPEDSLAAGWVFKPAKTHQPTQLTPLTPRVNGIARLVRLLGLTALLAGAGTVVGFSLWTSAVLIFRPHPPQWLTAYLPDGRPWGDAPLQSLADIEAELSGQQSLGDLLDLSQLSDAAELQGLQLLPIVETRSPCSRNCDQIVELRLYSSPAADSLQLLDQLRVQGPSEAQVLDPIARGDTGTMGSTHRLPLEALKPLHEEGLPGGWLTLTGRWHRQGSPVLYGQLLYVDAQTRRLQSVLNWQSPTGRLPAWHNVDQVGLPELLVNQSTGLEPDFYLYRVSRANAANTTTRLQEISLAPLPLPPDTAPEPYQNALFLAKQGLWSEAQALLSPLKTQLAEQWSPDLEQQRQLIMLHAKFSQNQANRDWSQPSQKLLALLLDGQWQAALDPVKAAEPGFERAVLPLLERESARVWQRLSASLKVTPQQPEARLWGALLLLAKENEKAALAWFNPNQQTTLKAEFDAIAQQVAPPALPAPAIATGNSSGAASPASTTASTAPSAAAGGLLGTVAALDRPNLNAWQPPDDDELALTSGQRWYTITVQASYGQQGWQAQLPALAVASAQGARDLMQTLGLSPGAQLPLLNPTTGQTGSAIQIRAVQAQGGSIALLASGPSTASGTSWVVATSGQWQSPAAIAPQSFWSLWQSQPELGDRLAATLQTHLGAEPTALRAAVQQTPALASVRRVNLLNEAESAIVLTLAPELVPSLGLTVSDPTVIDLVISPSGELLYSDLWGQSAALVGWLQPPAGPAALVTRQGDRVELLVWSPQNRQFQ